MPRMKSTLLPDGSYELVLHQSDINTYMTCPERARLLWEGMVDDFTSGEAAIGTSFHTAVERFQGGDTPEEALGAAMGQMKALSEDVSFRWVKVKTLATAHKHIATCWQAWYENVYPLIGWPIAVEQSFNLPFITIDLPGGTEVYIRLAGTIDFVEEGGEVIDWKTGGDLRKYTSEGWKLTRYGMQATVYTWAAHQLGLALWQPVRFTWAAVERTSGRHAFLTCERDKLDWAWLHVVCANIAQQWYGDHTSWPLNDQHALCSADWCPAWSTCKGATCDNGHVSLLQTAGT